MPTVSSVLTATAAAAGARPPAAAAACRRWRGCQPKRAAANEPRQPAPAQREPRGAAAAHLKACVRGTTFFFKKKKMLSSDSSLRLRKCVKFDSRAKLLKLSDKVTDKVTLTGAFTARKKNRDVTG